jgi:hypothetical protein
MSRFVWRSAGCGHCSTGISPGDPSRRSLAEGVSQLAFRMRYGLLHDYPIYAPLPDARAERPNLYGDLNL